MASIKTSIMVAHSVQVVYSWRKRCFFIILVTFICALLLEVGGEVEACEGEVNQVFNFLLLADLGVGHSHEAALARGLALLSLEPLQLYYQYLGHLVQLEAFMDVLLLTTVLAVPLVSPVKELFPGEGFQALVQSDRALLLALLSLIEKGLVEADL